jgi:hypothetical protein
VAKLGRGSFLAPPHLKISDTTFEKVQSTGKVQLRSDDPKKLEDCLYRYMCMTEIIGSGLNSKRADTFARKLQSHTKALVELLESVDLTGPLTEEQHVLQEVFYRKAERRNSKQAQTKFLEELRDFLRACEETQKSIESAIVEPTRHKAKSGSR